MATRTVSFTLDDKKDNDICDWLDQQDGRTKSQAIREVLRAYLREKGVGNLATAIESMHHDIKEMKMRIESGVTTSTTGTTQDEWVEPPDITANLAKLIMQ